MTNTPEVDWDALAAKYHTDPDTLPPDVRERTDRALADRHQKLANGQTLPTQNRTPYQQPIGLDENLQPYAVRTPNKQPRDPAPAEEPE